jgi:DNA topoisomerase-3
LDDFTSKRGRPFSAFLVRTGNKIGFEFPPRAAPADATKFPIVEGVVAICPIHKVNIIETETTYQPEEDGTECKIQLMREISKRVITREEANQLIEKKSLGPFDDFISKKTQKPFSSSLYLKKNESVGYKFAKRN